MSITSRLGGGYLLSHFRSTIGVVRLNFSVRNGKRWDPHAMTTLFFCLFQPLPGIGLPGGCDDLKRPSGERSHAKTLPRLHCGSRVLEPRFFSSNCMHCISLAHRRRTSMRADCDRESFRVISTARLRTLPPVHLPPIYVVVCNDPKGDLILRLASCLDAFSTYPYPTRLPGRAPGGTTGWPEVGPTRSSRTSVSTTQDSCAHDR